MESSPTADSREVGHPFALSPFHSTTLTFIVVVLFLISISLYYQMIVLKSDYLFCNHYRLTRSCTNSIDMPPMYIPFPQFPPMVTSSITVLQDQDLGMDMGITCIQFYTVSITWFLSRVYMSVHYSHLHPQTKHRAWHI